MRDRPSQTAVKIARFTAWLGRRPETRDLLPPDAASTTEALLRAGGHYKDWHARVYRSRVFHWTARATERWMMPGQSVGLALRRRFMDDETRQAIADGADQVLILGAGLDTLAPRLAREFPAVTFIEIDHPATQAAKRHALEAMGALGEDLHLVPVDLAEQDLASVLADLEIWRRDAETMVVAEGLLMYLAEPDVSALFESVRAETGVGSRLAFSYFAANARGEPDVGGRAGLLQASLSLIGEPWHWAVPDIDGFLRARGYRALAPPSRQDARQRYLEPLGRGDEPVGVELLAVAEVV